MSILKLQKVEKIMYIFDWDKKWGEISMAHHSIIFTCKDNIDIPEEHKAAWNDFVKELGDVILCITKTEINFCCVYDNWQYADDIEYLIAENKLTLGMIEAYKWLKENTVVWSDCWNPCDMEFGPDCWEDIERKLDYLKDRIRVLEISMRNHK